jgi:flotillin
MVAITESRQEREYGMGPIIIIVALLVVALIVTLGVLASMFQKVGPNEALVVSGFGGTQVVQGGGRVVWPLLQTSRRLSMELMSFDVAPQQALYTKQGVALNVEAVTQIKVKSDPVSIRTAAEQFLSKPPQERENLIRLVMEGHLRGITGLLTVESIVKEPEMVAAEVRSGVSDDLSKMGLEVISFTIREVRDDNEYIANMGRPDIARIRREADIAAAEAQRDTEIKQAQAAREAAVARALADQETTIARAASETKQAEAIRDLNLKKAEYEQSVRAQQAQTDKAYEIETNVQQQKVVAEQVNVELVRKQREAEVQQAEIKRRESELIATILRPAEIEKQKIEALAAAEQNRLRLEAEGRGAAIRATGQAEADVIRQKGEAEADAMRKRADAYALYSQAAVLDKVLTSLPDLAKNLSESVKAIDNVTIVSTGSDGAGASRITNDVATMVAQVPALVEALSGINIADLIKALPGLQGASQNGKSGNGSRVIPGTATPAPTPGE